jgi:hypothetical protein
VRIGTLTCASHNNADYARELIREIAALRFRFDSQTNGVKRAFSAQNWLSSLRYIVYDKFHELFNRGASGVYECGDEKVRGGGGRKYASR